MTIREQDIPEFQALYKSLFYKKYDVNQYRFLGVHFITGESEPVIITGVPHAIGGSNIYCIADANGITQVCESFDEAKREIGV